tara:strand:- start:266 stop:481 length:216 start_codon:yes stop_codon:yes gene_type:complete
VTPLESPSSCCGCCDGELSERPLVSSAATPLKSPSIRPGRCDGELSDLPLVSSVPKVSLRTNSALAVAVSS